MKIFELKNWLDERLSISTLAAMAQKKEVPVHRQSIWYYFGGMTLFLFVVQVVTGILLLLYYRPSSENAFESVQFIITEVKFGWLIRSIHSWSANLMIATLFIHLFSVFFLRAYYPPREITWLSGVFLLFIVICFGFSGYLLPWNKLAFFATKVGTEIAGVVPVVGRPALRFLRGGDDVTGATLTRFFGFHVAVLPATATVFIAIHVLLVQLHGMHVPKKYEDNYQRMKFFPNFILRDAIGWILAIGVLAALAAIFPWELGEKADAFAPAQTRSEEHTSELQSPYDLVCRLLLEKKKKKTKLPRTSRPAKEAASARRSHYRNTRRDTPAAVKRLGKPAGRARPPRAAPLVSLMNAS